MRASAAAARPSTPSMGPLAALVLLALIWGYNWVVMKVALRDVGPLDFAALRTALGVLLLFGVMVALRIPLAPRHVGRTVWLGVLQTTGFIGLISWALASGAAGRSAVLAYTMPFWVILFGWMFLDERLHRRQWLAVGAMAIGLVLVLEVWNSSASLFASLVALVAGALWAVGVIVFKTIPVAGRDDLLSLTAWQMLYGGVPLVIVAVLVPEPPIVWSGTFVAALAYNAMGGMALATVLWLYVLYRLPATISGLNALAVPVVGVVAAWWQLGEQPSAAARAGMVLILAGLAVLALPARRG